MHRLHGSIAMLSAVGMGCLIEHPRYPSQCSDDEKLDDDKLDDNGLQRCVCTRVISGRKEEELVWSMYLTLDHCLIESLLSVLYVFFCVLYT